MYEKRNIKNRFKRDLGFGVSPEQGEESIAGEPDATLDEIRHTQVKLVTFNYSGAELDSMATNGMITFHLRASWGQSGQFWDNFAEVKDIRVTQTFENSTVPLAMRSDKAHNYGAFGHEKIDEAQGSGNAVDMGDRWLDTRLGRTFKEDRQKHLFPGVSSYSYAANTPINAIDPDGEVVIFINGQHTGDGGSRRYWRRKTEFDERGNKTQSASSFDIAVMNQIGDYNARYYDGSSGGFTNTIFRGAFLGNNIIPGNRRRAGAALARQEAEDIIANLERDAEGNIIESVKIVTHSMGGAFGKGFAKALLAYAKEHDIDINIEFEVDFAPFQPEQQTAVDEVPTIQVSNTNDNVTNLVRNNGKIDGADVFYDPDPHKGHSIFDFLDKIKDFIPESETNGSGKSTFEEKPENNTP